MAESETRPVSAPRAPGRVPRPAGRRGPESRAGLLFPRGPGREQKRLRRALHPRLSNPFRLEPTTRAPALHPVPFLKLRTTSRARHQGLDHPQQPRSFRIMGLGTDSRHWALNPRPCMGQDPSPESSLEPRTPDRNPRSGLEPRTFTRVAASPIRPRSRTPDPALSLRPRHQPAPRPAARPRRLRPIPHPGTPGPRPRRPPSTPGDRPPHPEEQEGAGG